jgi:hypothetical protein
LNRTIAIEQRAMAQSADAKRTFDIVQSSGAERLIVDSAGD